MAVGVQSVKRLIQKCPHKALSTNFFFYSLVDLRGLTFLTEPFFLYKVSDLLTA
uniref:Uncharacterized protein n=1 Tax=Lepeophtheirus salmonis TaxID=72036 RepID=A0A0K2TXI7_LEPSM